MATDPLSIIADFFIGVGSAVIGGLGTWAAVSGKFGRLETKVAGVEKTAERLEKKIDDNQKDTERVNERRHQENQQAQRETNQAIRDLGKRLDDAIIVDRRKPGDRTPP